MINDFRDRVHAANVEAGWWTDLETNTSILETRNRPEMLCLIISEVSEAFLGGFEPDSHLPQFPAFHTELADAAIRILDQAGADKIDLEISGEIPEPTGNPLNDCMTLTVIISSYALEGWRKSKTEKYHAAMLQAFHFILKCQEVYDFNLWEVMEAKMAYNAQREDHKIENRKQADGKKF